MSDYENGYGNTFFGECRSCGGMLRTNEWDGECYSCSHPQPKDTTPGAWEQFKAKHPEWNL
jgi:hypothetical protein